jgi:hypothetical protein
VQIARRVTRRAIACLTLDVPESDTASLHQFRSRKGDLYRAILASGSGSVCAPSPSAQGFRRVDRSVSWQFPNSPAVDRISKVTLMTVAMCIPTANAVDLTGATG